MKEHTQFDPAQQPAATGDMDPEAFRRYGHQVVDWISDYLANVSTYPVLAPTSPGDIRRYRRQLKGLAKRFHLSEPVRAQPELQPQPQKRSSPRHPPAPPSACRGY